MSDLSAIVRATRASANSLAAMQTTYRKLSREAFTPDAERALQRKYLSARRRYEAAQRVLSDNPLPGDAR